MASDASQSAQSTRLTDGQPKIKTGRPKKTVDMDRLKAFMACYPSEENAALFFDMHIKTLNMIIKRETGLTFAQFREKYVIHTKHTLVQMALHRALKDKSDRMLEMCLKNIAKWDGTYDPVQQAPIIQLNYSLEAPPALPEPKDVTPKKEPA